MTDDDILKMAREAGGTWEYRRTFPVACVMYDEELIRFAELVAAAEREACAELADRLDPLQDGGIGQAIRARREK